TGDEAPDASHLRRLVGLARRLNAETRLQPLLEEVLDAAIELAGAERGFLLLRPENADAAGEPDEARLEVAAARNMDVRTLAGDARSISRSIAARAISEGEPIVTVDAGVDARFE